MCLCLLYVNKDSPISSQLCASKPGLDQAERQSEDGEVPAESAPSVASSHHDGHLRNGSRCVGGRVE